MYVNEYLMSVNVYVMYTYFMQRKHKRICNVCKRICNVCKRMCNVCKRICNVCKRICYVM